MNFNEVLYDSIQERLFQEPADVEAAVVTRKRKTTQNDQSHGSFFLRMGAIGNNNFKV